MMAKIRPGYTKRGKTRWIDSEVTLSRTGSAEAAFEACVRVGSSKGSHYPGGSKVRMTGKHTECAVDRNPRKALAKALARASKKIGTRKGAFKGIK